MASPNGVSANAAKKADAKLITLDNMNPNIVKMEYAVRGPLVIRAGEIERELKSVSEIQIFCCWIHCVVYQR